MDISDSTAQVGQAAAIAVQKLTLDMAMASGASLVTMIASAPTGSVNSASQGRHLDIRA